MRWDEKRKPPARYARWDDVPAEVRDRVEARLARYQPAKLDTAGQPTRDGLDDEDPSGLLDLSSCDLHAGAVEAFLIDRLPSFRGVAELRLRGNLIGDIGATALAKHLRAVPNLRSLDISCNAIGTAGAAEIAKLTGVTTLDISDNQVGDAGAAGIARLTGLTTLNINHNLIGAAGAAEIARLTGLTTLDIGGNSIGTAGAAEIAKLTGLTTLDIGNNWIGDAGAEHIAKLAGLITLDIGGNSIGAAGTAHIATLTHLTRLELGCSPFSFLRNSIGDAGAEHITKLTRLTVLDIRCNSIGDPGAAEIAMLTGLTTLDIGHNSIGDAGAAEIAKLTSLTSLDIGNNSIGDAGAAEIAKLTSLTSFGISGNQIGDASTIIALIEALQGQGKLTRVGVTLNPLHFGSATVDESVLLETDPAKLLQALKALRDGSTSDEALFGRMVTIGPTGNGKSTITRFASYDSDRHNRIDPGPKGRTVGFDARRIEDTSDSSQPPLRITVIDTGGHLEQHQSHCNLIYQNTRRSMFGLVLRRDQTWEQNRAVWYLTMLNGWHGEQRRSGHEAPLPVLITTTRSETPAGNVLLQLPKLEDLQSDFKHLEIHVLDPNIRWDGSKLLEAEDKQTRQRVIDLMRRQTFATRVLKEQLRVEEALRAHFELDVDNPRQRPRVCFMSRDEFRVWLKAQAITPEFEGMHVRYLADAMALVATGTHAIEDRASEGEDGRSWSASRRRPWDRSVGTIFNPRFVLGLVYQVTMDPQVRQANGFMSAARYDELTDMLNGTERQELLKLLQDYQMVFAWQRPGMLSSSTDGYLVPDQLPERLDKHRERWDDAAVTAQVEVRAWLGEHRVFELLANAQFGRDRIRLLKVRDEERAGAQKDGVELLGIWRNEVCLISEDRALEALVQTDVFHGKVSVSVKGGAADRCRGFAESILTKLLQGLDDWRDQVQWGPKPSSPIRDRDGRGRAKGENTYDAVVERLTKLLDEGLWGSARDFERWGVGSKSLVSKVLNKNPDLKSKLDRNLYLAHLCSKALRDNQNATKKRLRQQQSGQDPEELKRQRQDYDELAASPACQALIEELATKSDTELLELVPRELKNTVATSWMSLDRPDRVKFIAVLQLRRNSSPDDPGD